MPSHSVFLNEICSKVVILSVPNLLRYYQSLTDLEERENTTHFSLPCRGREVSNSSHFVLSLAILFDLHNMCVLWGKGRAGWWERVE